MQYTQLNMGVGAPYPNNSIDPKDKDAAWCLQYAKAAYNDFNSVYLKGVFSGNGGDYAKYRMYAMGKQPINQYKSLMGVDAQTNQTQLSVDWTVRAVVSGYRDKAISRMMKEDYGIVATPIDMLAKSELDDYLARMKVKMLVRQQMLQQNPELGNHPLIAMQPGEPSDVEELEMRLTMSEQFNRSKDAEMAIELGMYENDYPTVRRRLYEDFFDLGVAGVKDWLGDDNKAKFRYVDPEAVVVSVSKDGSFKDLVHAGELIDVSLIELATVKDEQGNSVFTEDELTEFAGTIAGKFGNPMSLGVGIGWLAPIDKFKCKVLDIEFFTYNENVYRDVKDEYDNEDFRKADYGRGKRSDKYIRKRYQYVYKCKWVVGTDKCYDWGMAYDQKRSNDLKKKAQTKLSYHFYAYNFKAMRAQGFMERLIPYLDDYQLTILRIQNWKNRAVPSGWWFNLDMMENVALNKGGKNMQPKELIQMFFDAGIMVGRSLQADGTPFPGNVQPIIPMENSSMTELGGLWNDLINTVQTIERMTGYNDVTSGQANPKTLVPGYETAEKSTNDALYPMMFAEENISLRLAEAVLCRMQQGIKKGGISGYAPALNSNMLRIIEVSPDIALRDYGIELEKKTSDDQKMWLLQSMNLDIQNGFLSSADAVTLVNTKNAKQAQQIWAFKVDRAKQKMQQDKMAQLQSTNDSNERMQQMGADKELKLQQNELMAKVQMNRDTIQGEFAKEQLRSQTQERIAMASNQTKLLVSDDTSQAKENAAHIAGSATVTKQILQNNKPEKASAS